MRNAKLLIIFLILLGIILVLDGPNKKEQKVGGINEEKTDQKGSDESSKKQEVSSSLKEVTPTNTPLPSPTTQISTNQEFVYPTATPLGNGKYETSDDPQTVTDWYKEKIISHGYTGRAFVQTKTNGNVKNVLSASKDDKEIKIEITRPADTNTTTIVLSIH